jgi:GNAT superfamily N-acetyltransferase
MTSPWLTRPVTQHDASTIAQHRFFNPQEDPGDLASYARWVDTRIGAGSYIGSVAEVNGEVIGGAGATLLDWGPTRGGRGPIKARIVNVYTMPSWRGRGVSRCLVEHVLARCQAMGIGTSASLTPRSCERTAYARRVLMLSVSSERCDDGCVLTTDLAGAGGC